MAQSLHDYRALPYAWGYLGRLYEEAQRYAEAIQLTRQAAWAAQQTHVPEALYLWHWQSARLLHALGDVHAAIVAYDRAIATVQSMRPELLHAYGSVDTSFRTSLGPLYFEQVDLLLRRAADLEAHPQAAILRWPRYPDHRLCARWRVAHAAIRCPPRWPAVSHGKVCRGHYAKPDAYRSPASG
jgi:tetratricopeptide (TPR) repeat protein